MTLEQYTKGSMSSVSSAFTWYGMHGTYTQVAVSAVKSKKGDRRERVEGLLSYTELHTEERLTTIEFYYGEQRRVCRY